MQKSLMAMAVLAAVASPACAQSTVSVFGLLDVGVQRLTNGSKTLNLVSIDGLQTSRFGVRGSEDLGGGNTASFHLEGAIGPDVGSGGDWRRRATVSLGNKSMGELRLGRDYTPTFWSISRFNAFGTNGVGAASNLIYGFDGLSGTSSTVVRANNSVGYFLPGGLGGVYGQFMVAAGEGAPGKYIGGRVGYAAGPLDVALGYSDTTNNAAGDKFKVTNLGASYDFGVAKVMGLYHVSKQTTREQTNWVIGATAPVSAAGVVRASYTSSTFTNSVGNVDYSGKQLALGYVHSLSKRTSVYTTASRVTNGTGAKFVIPGGSTVTSGQSSSGYELGLMHTF